MSLEEQGHESRSYRSEAVTHSLDITVIFTLLSGRGPDWVTLFSLNQYPYVSL